MRKSEVNNVCTVALLTAADAQFTIQITNYRSHDVYRCCDATNAICCGFCCGNCIRIWHLVFAMALLILRMLSAVAYDAVYALACAAKYAVECNCFQGVFVGRQAVRNEFPIGNWC
jgi:hypothetical protein